jgi:PadR family transcriptional regulator, regulatory protein PadR
MRWSGKMYLLPGTLDLLILKALSSGPLRGLEISQSIEQITRRTFRVETGSLFPALHRMKEQGWLASSWDESESNRWGKCYDLTEAGRQQLQAEKRQWEQIAMVMDRALGATWSEDEEAERIPPNKVGEEFKRGVPI